MKNIDSSRVVLARKIQKKFKTAAQEIAKRDGSRLDLDSRDGYVVLDNAKAPWTGESLARRVTDWCRPARATISGTARLNNDGEVVEMDISRKDGHDSPYLESYKRSPAEEGFGRTVLTYSRLGSVDSLTVDSSGNLLELDSARGLLRTETREVTNFLDGETVRQAAAHRSWTVRV